MAGEEGVVTPKAKEECFHEVEDQWMHRVWVVHVIEGDIFKVTNIEVWLRRRQETSLDRGRGARGSSRDGAVASAPYFDDHLLEARENSSGAKIAEVRNSMATIAMMQYRGSAVGAATVVSGEGRLTWVRRPRRQGFMSRCRLRLLGVDILPVYARLRLHRQSGCSVVLRCVGRTTGDHRGTINNFGWSDAVPTVFELSRVGLGVDICIEVLVRFTIVAGLATVKTGAWPPADGVLPLLDGVGVAQTEVPVLVAGRAGRMFACAAGLPLATGQACGVDPPAFGARLALVVDEADLLGCGQRFVVGIGESSHNWRRMLGARVDTVVVASSGSFGRRGQPHALPRVPAVGCCVGDDSLHEAHVDEVLRGGSQSHLPKLCTILEQLSW